MKAFIKKIALFSSDGAMRDVPLDEGLNIITGDSKTGKSALIEIVDYCLFSSRSTIPVGKITTFAELYCVIVKVSKKYIIIARPKWGGKHTKAYFSIETNDDFLETFSHNYFDSKALRPLKTVQVDFEEHLGLSVLDTRENGQISKKGSGKATMRSFIPFLFQHQNLIANKHSLFYRFDDFYKRKDAVDQFPILMGWVDGKYYSIRQQLEEKKSLQRSERIREESLKLSKDEQIERLHTPLNQYYKALGYVLEKDLSLGELKKRARSLPDIPQNAYENSDLSQQLLDLSGELEGLRLELSGVQALIKQIGDNSSVAGLYGNKIQHLVLANNAKNYDGEIVCPFCNSVGSEVKEVADSVAHSRDELISELSSIGSYQHDSSDHLRSLIDKKSEIKKRIRFLTVEINGIERASEEAKSNASLREGLQFLRGVIEVTLDQILSKPTLGQSSVDLEELDSEIVELQAIIDSYNLSAKYAAANSFLSKRMTDISRTLDFEKELQPGVMRFDLKKFDFYYNYEKKDIMLSEMGSGANWLACHLSLFLSLLHLFCKEEESSVPSFLFVDQPSQVYFPKASGVLSKEIEMLKGEEGRKEADENIYQVNNIFKVLLNELDVIKEDCGFSPQIVVMEHADEGWFAPHVKKRWATGGDKLI